LLAPGGGLAVVVMRVKQKLKQATRAAVAQPNENV
jgi:hypothetical protein